MKVHLNGGPRDDQCTDVNGSVLRVAIMRRVTAMTSEAETDPHINIGEYRMRMDGFGYPVPHNLEGVIEYDWLM